MRRLLLVLSALGSLAVAGGYAQAHPNVTGPVALQSGLVEVQWGGPGPYDDRGGYRDEQRHEEWRAREEERRREEWHHRRWLCEHRGICG